MVWLWFSGTDPGVIGIQGYQPRNVTVIIEEVADDEGL